MSAAPPNMSDARLWAPSADPLVVGLVNCASAAARRTTERQFRELVIAGAGARRVEIRLLALPDTAGMDGDDTWDEGGIDGLIVTGMEPRAAALPQEPCWPGLQRLADWAEAAGVPVIWSCLAAHAAVLHQSGVHRQLRAEKLSGVYECCKAVDHPLLAGLPLSWRVPHSRCNELDADALAARGYCVISRSAVAGADMFVREANSLSLFIQGHPEYDPHTLLLEYRRDVGRFLAGERDTYPALPENYFDAAVTAALLAFRAEALHARHPDRLAAFPMPLAAQGLAHPWRALAVGLYANWLSLLAARKAATLALTPLAAAGGIGPVLTAAS